MSANGQYCDNVTVSAFCAQALERTGAAWSSRSGIHWPEACNLAYRRPTMPRLKTRTRSTYSPAFQLATSLRQRGKRNFVTFDSFVDEQGSPPDLITIGRSPDSDIVIADDLTVSYEHAEIRRGSDGKLRLMRAPGCKNGVFVNGHFLDEPAVLVVGMRIRMGDTHLFAADDKGSTPLAGHTLDDCISYGKDVYGSNMAAAEYIARSPGHVRECTLPSPLRRQRRAAKKQANRARRVKRTSRRES